MQPVRANIYDASKRRFLEEYGHLLNQVFIHSLYGYLVSAAPRTWYGDQILKYTLPRLLNCCSELNMNILCDSVKGVRSIFVRDFFIDFLYT